MQLEYCFILSRRCSASEMFFSRRVVTFEALIRKCWVSLLERTSKCYNIDVCQILNSDIRYKSKLFKLILEKLYVH